MPPTCRPDDPTDPPDESPADPRQPDHWSLHDVLPTPDEMTAAFQPRVAEARTLEELRALMGEIRRAFPDWVHNCHELYAAVMMRRFVFIGTPRESREPLRGAGRP